MRMALYNQFLGSPCWINNAATAFLICWGIRGCSARGAMVGRKHHMNHARTYCGYSNLTIMRDYTGAPHATCPRCYRADLLYRVNPLNSLVRQTAAPPQKAGITKPGDTASGSFLEPSSAK